MPAAGRAALLALLVAGRAALLALLMAASPARAAELVLYETPNCAWCIKWHRDIGARYANTRAGHLLPLRRVDMLKPLPADLADISRVAAIPTFVVVECGQEVGRVVGYRSEGAFWNDLAGVVNAESETPSPSRCAGPSLSRWRERVLERNEGG